jgi:Ca2+/Na+ antiporter
MIDYMKMHEKHIHDTLNKNLNNEELKELLSYHDKQIRWMQHERLVHLIVMLSVCFLTLLIFGFTLIKASMPVLLLAVIFLILSVAYLIHYFRLENRVQKWYGISNEIKQTIR